MIYVNLHDMYECLACMLVLSPSAIYVAHIPFYFPGMMDAFMVTSLTVVEILAIPHPGQLYISFLTHIPLLPQFSQFHSSLHPSSLSPTPLQHHGHQGFQLVPFILATKTCVFFSLCHPPSLTVTRMS